MSSDRAVGVVGFHTRHHLPGLVEWFEGVSVGVGHAGRGLADLASVSDPAVPEVGEDARHVGGRRNAQANRVHVGIQHVVGGVGVAVIVDAHRGVPEPGVDRVPEGVRLVGVGGDVGLAADPALEPDHVLKQLVVGQAVLGDLAALAGLPVVVVASHDQTVGVEPAGGVGGHVAQPSQARGVHPGRVAAVPEVLDGGDRSVVGVGHRIVEAAAALEADRTVEPAAGLLQVQEGVDRTPDVRAAVRPYREPGCRVGDHQVTGPDGTVALGAVEDDWDREARGYAGRYHIHLGGVGPGVPHVVELVVIGHEPALVLGRAGRIGPEVHAHGGQVDRAAGREPDRHEPEAAAQSTRVGVRAVDREGNRRAVVVLVIAAAFDPTVRLARVYSDRAGAGRYGDGRVSADFLAEIEKDGGAGARQGGGTAGDESVGIGHAARRLSDGHSLDVGVARPRNEGLPVRVGWPCRQA